MSNGVGLLEVIIVLTISVTILSIAINSVSESSVVTKKLTSNQQQLEAIFFAVDMIKSDLTRCGMRLQEVQKVSDTGWFEKTTQGFIAVYGIFGDTSETGLFTGDRNFSMNPNGFCKKNKEIVLFNLEHESFEKNCIKEVKKDELMLKSPAKNDYYPPFLVVVLKKVEYKFDPKKKILSRKVDRGYFQPLIENVTDFFIHYYEESSSVLYRIEVNRKEQVRGYIFFEEYGSVTSKRGNIIVSIILIMAVTVMGLGLLTYSLFHEKVVRARNRRLIASDKIYQDTILQIHQFREKVFGESFIQYTKPEEEFFTNEHFPDVAYQGNIFSHAFRYYKFVRDEYETLRIFDDFRVRSQRLPYGFNAGIRVNLVSGKIPISMIPVVIKDKIVEWDQMETLNKSPDYYSRDSVAVELEIINFLLDSLDLMGPDFDWEKLRIRLGFEPEDNPPDTGIYFVRSDNVIKSIFIQGDVDQILFTVDSDMQGVMIVQQGKEYQLWYVPGTPYFLSWNENLGESEIFDERIIVHGSVSYVGQVGGWAFTEDTALSLFVSGHLTLSGKLIGVPFHGEKYWNHLLIINSSKGFNGLQDSLAVIDDVDDQDKVQMDVSLVVQGKIINHHRDVEIEGSIYCSELENNGSIRINGVPNQSSGGGFFHTKGMSLLKDFFVNFIEEDFGE